MKNRNLPIWDLDKILDFSILIGLAIALYGFYVDLTKRELHACKGVGVSKEMSPLAP